MSRFRLGSWERQQQLPPVWTEGGGLRVAPRGRSVAGVRDWNSGRCLSKCRSPGTAPAAWVPIAVLSGDPRKEPWSAVGHLGAVVPGFRGWRHPNWLCDLGPVPAPLSFSFFTCTVKNWNF